MILLKVDERGALVTGLGQQVELIEQAIAQKDLAEVPDYALAHGALAAAEPVENLECALRETDRAAALGGLVVLVHEQHVHPVLGEIDRRAQSHRSGAHHHYAVAAGLAGDQFRGFAVCE